jgi:membrane-associated phospholipid phosphatase
MTFHLEFGLLLGFCLFLLLLHAATWLLVRHYRQMLLRVSRQSSSRLWARTHPLRYALQNRFPRLMEFSGRRLDPLQASGLPLTLLLVVIGYTAFLIGSMIEELLTAEEILQVDRMANLWVEPYRVPLLVSIFSWITGLGASYTLAAVLLVTTGFCWACGRRYLILPLWIAIIGAESTTWLGKFAFSRARPDFVTAVTAFSFSFPSGHATGAMAVYGFIAYALARDLRSLRERFEVIYWTLMLVLLIGFSRILLGVHYFTDVAAGLLVGLFWLLAGITIGEWRQGKRSRPAASEIAGLQENDSRKDAKTQR